VYIYDGDGGGVLRVRKPRRKGKWRRLICEFAHVILLGWVSSI
jgi:hypothetical protein